MEKLVVFRDRQELDPEDLNGIEEIARASIDRIVREAVTDEAKYVGLQTAATTVTSVSVGAGAFIVEGRVYGVTAPAPINLYENLPVSNRKIISIVAFGQDDVADRIEERDVLTDADSDEVEPQAVAMRLVRLGSVSKLVGTENVDPQPPTVPQGSILVATVLMGTAGIISVTMSEENRLPSLKRHGERLVDLDNFRKRAEPQIGALSTQLAALEQRTNDKVSRADFLPIKLDLARLKERVNLPDNYSEYGADRFDSDDETDPASAAGHTLLERSLGFKSSTVLRPMTLLNPTDPLVKRYDTNWIQPASTPVQMLEVPGSSGSVNMSSYQTQGAPVQVKKTGYRSVTYQDYGGPTTYEQQQAWGYTYDYVVAAGWGQPAYYVRTVQEAYDYYETQPGPVVTHTGVQISQTVLAPRSFNCSQIGFFIEQLDASGDVTVILCETKDGKPNLAAALAKVTVAYADLKSGGLETVATIKPALVEAGKLYGIVLITQGGHKIIMGGAGYTEGQFYYGQDGDWVTTDATRDLKLKLYANKFNRTRTEVALGTVTLAGGIDSFAWKASVLIPDGTDFFVEAKVAGVWHALDDFGFLDNRPDTLELRGVFLGTSDLQPSVELGADKITLRRMEDTLDHLSTVRTLAAAKQNFVVDLILHNYDEDSAAQDLEVTLKSGAGYATSTTASSVTVVPDTLYTKRVRFTFHTASAVTSYKIAIHGERDTDLDADVPPFTVTERIDAAIT
ncbi:MAG: hypothetical protein DI604_26880 [Delftia acidovorans]|nr:MAG: hypothetical protein DI604_26880 [Delftia acidovorans]